MSAPQPRLHSWPVPPQPRRSFLLALPFQVAFVAAALVAMAAGVPHVQLGLALLLVPALWAPVLVELVMRTRIPFALQLHYLIFMTAGPYAGSVLNVYGYIPYWDKLVHFDSGVMLGWLGFLIVRRAEERVGMPLPRWFAYTVAQLTPMAFAALWEICEFTSDHLIGTHAQLNNGDTMGDIVAGTLGGVLSILIMAIWKRPRTVAPYGVRKDLSTQSLV